MTSFMAEMYPIRFRRWKLCRLSVYLLW